MSLANSEPTFDLFVLLIYSVDAYLCFDGCLYVRFGMRRRFLRYVYERVGCAATAFIGTYSLSIGTSTRT